MLRHRFWLIIVLAGALQLGACAQAASETSKPKAATVEPIAGTSINKVTLTEKAAQRLRIATVPLAEQAVKGQQRKIMPYAALLYDLKGDTWAYTSPAPLTFVRQPVVVDYIDGERVVLKDGPPTGTAIVTVGVPELYGTDTGIGK